MLCRSASVLLVALLFDCAGLSVESPGLFLEDLEEVSFGRLFAGRTDALLSWVKDTFELVISWPLQILVRAFWLTCSSLKMLFIISSILLLICLSLSWSMCVCSWFVPLPKCFSNHSLFAMQQFRFLSDHDALLQEMVLIAWINAPSSGCVKCSVSKPTIWSYRIPRWLAIVRAAILSINTLRSIIFCFSAVPRAVDRFFCFKVLIFTSRSMDLTFSNGSWSFRTISIDGTFRFVSCSIFWSCSELIPSLNIHWFIKPSTGSVLSVSWESCVTFWFISCSPPASGWDRKLLCKLRKICGFKFAGTLSILFTALA